MPKLSLDVPHTLGKEEAARRLKDRFEFARGAYQAYISDLQENWLGDTLSFSLKAMGMKVAGTMAVEETVVKLVADLPMAAMMIKGKITERAREELGKVLA